MSIKSFFDLQVWQLSHDFVIYVNNITRNYPRDEIYGLISQFRRAAVSIPANIAEGFGKVSKKEKVHFLSISQGSLEECRYYIILSRDLGYIDINEENLLMERITEISKMLSACTKSLQRYHS